MAGEIREVTQLNRLGIVIVILGVIGLVVLGMFF